MTASRGSITPQQILQMFTTTHASVFRVDPRLPKVIMRACPKMLPCHLYYQTYLQECSLGLIHIACKSAKQHKASRHLFNINCDDYFDDEMKSQEYSDEISELEAELAATRDKVPNINMLPKKSACISIISERRRSNRSDVSAVSQLVSEFILANHVE